MISPCIKVCKIAPGTDACVGCFRTLTDIRNWYKMTDTERLQIVEKVNMKQDRKLLEEVVDWWDHDYGNGNFSSLVVKIKKHLENCDAQESIKTTQVPKCANPFCERHTLQE